MTVHDRPTHHESAGNIWIKIELVFGMADHTGRPISDAEWAEFADHEIAPRFPDGMTVLRGSGRWKNTRGKTVHIGAHLVILLAQPHLELDGKVEAVRNAYKERFRQHSVIRMDSRPAVSF